MRHHRSASPRRGTCLRFSAAGAARNRSPLSPRHLSPQCYDRSRSRVRLSFHLPPLRHLTTRSARVRSRSQLLLYIVPGLSSESSPETLGGCRCALYKRNNRSALFLRSAALTLRSLLLIPASCLSAQGITARLAAFLHTPALCADRRTERQARLAFSRSAGLVTACRRPLRHCSAPFLRLSLPAANPAALLAGSSLTPHRSALFLKSESTSMYSAPPHRSLHFSTVRLSAMANLCSSARRLFLCKTARLAAFAVLSPITALRRPSGLRSAAATARKVSRRPHPAAVTPRSWSRSSAPGCVNALSRIITARVLPGCGCSSSAQIGAVNNSTPP